MSIRLPQLTSREIRILEALADGANSKELAHIIQRSRGTVEAEIRVLFGKLNARSRHHLVAQAFRMGVLPLLSQTAEPVA